MPSPARQSKAPRWLWRALLARPDEGVRAYAGIWGALELNSTSPTTVGFRLLFRRPLIPLAEVAWRWIFAAAAWVLGIAFVFEYFGSLPVTRADRFLLSTGQPFLIAQAIRRIFHGSSVRFVEAGILLGLGLAIAWIGLASFGRLAVLHSMFEEFEWDTQANHPVRTLFFLNFLRAATLLAAKVAALGSILMASSFWASTHVRVVDSVRLVFVAWFLIWLAWAVLNWLLSAAAVFVIAEGRNSLSSMSAMLRLLQSRTGRVLGASAVFGLIHGGAFVVAGGVLLVLLPIAIAQPIALPLVFAVILAYCFVADFLYTGRLGAYAYLAIGREELPSWMAVPRVPFPETPASASVDKDELILGDLPAPA